MARTFAISDIHGCGISLDHLVSKEIKLKKSDELFLLGDYIDRGKNSKMVIDIILDLVSKRYKVKCLRGNHEQMFLDTQNDDVNHLHWKAVFGGNSTLSSFNINHYDELDEKYKSFFEGLSYYFESKKNIFVHAGLNFSNENIFEDLHYMLWSRGMKINKELLGERKVIHGHTPRRLDELQKQISENENYYSINIDTGCAYKKESGFGNLSAIELTKMQLFFTENLDS
jgi:serine/threonine protein phosphatase 1